MVLFSTKILTDKILKITETKDKIVNHIAE